MKYFIEKPSLCLTKNLPLDSSQNHLYSKCLQLCNKIISLLMFLLQNAQKLLSCVDFGRFFMRQCVVLLSFWKNGLDLHHMW